MSNFVEVWSGGPFFALESWHIEDLLSFLFQVGAMKSREMFSKATVTAYSGDLRKSYLPAP
jgi:hypothetical protein